MLFYATSNRRHLLPRTMMENEQSTAINPSEAIEEKVSLSDRFGLWLGFYKCNQGDYLAMIDGYAEHFTLGLTRDELHREALEWATTRGGRSGALPGNISRIWQVACASRFRKTEALASKQKSPAQAGLFRIPQTQYKARNGICQARQHAPIRGRSSG